MHLLLCALAHASSGPSIPQPYYIVRRELVKLKDYRGSIRVKSFVDVLTSSNRILENINISICCQSISQQIAVVRSKDWSLYVGQILFPQAHCGQPTRTRIFTKNGQSPRHQTLAQKFPTTLPTPILKTPPHTPSPKITAFAPFCPKSPPPPLYQYHLSLLPNLACTLPLQCRPQISCTPFSNQPASPFSSHQHVEELHHTKWPATAVEELHGGVAAYWAKRFHGWLVRGPWKWEFQWIILNAK